MVHQNVTMNWVYEHFLAYLHLSIADCDCIVSQKELNNLSCFTLLKNLSPERGLKLVKEVYIEFLSHTDEEKRAYIRENVSKFLRTESIKNRVIVDLEDAVLQKDEESEEYIMFRYIRKVINNCK